MTKKNIELRAQLDTNMANVKENNKRTMSYGDYCISINDNQISNNNELLYLDNNSSNDE